eukprot:scaffold216442_cov31-Tisochrysis_lutea.AAC.3
MIPCMSCGRSSRARRATNHTAGRARRPPAQWRCAAAHAQAPGSAPSRAARSCRRASRRRPCCAHPPGTNALCRPGGRA